MASTSIASDMTGKLITHDERAAFTMMGIKLTPKVTAADTAGAFSLIEQVVSPGSGSPPHILHEGHKIIYVVDGSFNILVGNQVVPAGPGDVAILPEGLLHNFRNVGDVPGKILVCLFPGGHEEFLLALSQVAQNGPPSKTVMAEVAGRYHVEMRA
ncbi:MAG: cupin domain-containing protein [Chloroflexi bacterium]|nr:cupin domain-containing protein [Chloroflexota bacterium]